MPKESNKHSSVGVVLFIAVLVPVLYVLSSGPACYLAENNFIGKGVVNKTYAPLIFISLQSEPVENVFLSYVAWWKNL